MNKKGFTLIELLAVIVILAIIALIATPIVLNIINETRDSAGLRSAEFYLDAVEQGILRNELKNKRVDNGEYNIIDGELCLSTDTTKCIEIEIDGQTPTGGTITITNGQITDVLLNIDGKEMTINSNGEIAYLLAPGLYDENDELLMSWEELEEKYDIKDRIEMGTSYDGAFENPGNIVGDVINSVEGASKLIIGKNVTSIGSNAFFGTSLKSIIIPNSVTSIGDSAFIGSHNLVSIIIPNSVTSIGTAFDDCTSLESVTISNSVTSILSGTFNSCTSLKSITIPNSVTSIGNAAFNNCPSLTTIYYNGTATGSPWGAENAEVVSN